MIQYRQDGKKRGVDMKNIERGYFTGERALFGLCDLNLKDSIFADGEWQIVKSSATLFRQKFERGKIAKTFTRTTIN